MWHFRRINLPGMRDGLVQRREWKTEQLRTLCGDLGVAMSAFPLSPFQNNEMSWRDNTGSTGTSPCLHFGLGLLEGMIKLYFFPNSKEHLILCFHLHLHTMGAIIIIEETYKGIIECVLIVEYTPRGWPWMTYCGEGRWWGRGACASVQICT